jgi:hypothetical protein|tara:strand:+ start:1522 stop:1980 length:459 start_codon:yes stop_codon:yes gene_type:complete
MQRLLSVPFLLILLQVAVPPIQAGPVLCSSSLEAGEAGTAPVEVTICEPVQSTSDMVTQRFFTWTAPYAGGVDLMHQITDLFGVALGGTEGNRWMGLGFPDQTIIWDSSSIHNAMATLLEQQSPAIPWRTMDLPNGFSAGRSGGVPGIAPLW